jgi:crossover junction endodeoxyribonuclease RuvC
MIILGVDPGSITTGYGVVERTRGGLHRVDSGVVSMRSAMPLAERLNRIYERLDALIREHAPDAFCLETAFYGKNVHSTLMLGHVRGVALLAAVRHGLPAAEYSPREVKRAVTGNGNAAKQQIAYMVASMLSLAEPPARLDESDGLALAICHAIRANAPRAAGTDWKRFVETHPERVRR